MNEFKKLGSLMQKGAFDAVETMVVEMLSGGTEADAIIDKGITPALDEIGEKFSVGECFIPEMMIAAKGSQRALDVIKNSIVEKDQKRREIVVIGTVQGDLHDIGKNIIAMTMEASGFEVKDLGVDVAPEKLVETLEQNESAFLCLSCLLTTTMAAMKFTVETIRGLNFGKEVKIIIGGPPTTQDFADEIGADYRYEGPYEALKQLKAWCGGRG